MTEPIAFDVFFAESSPRVLARALVLAANRHDAEDAVQDAYAEALRRWDRIGRTTRRRRGCISWCANGCGRCRRGGGARPR